MARPPNIRAVRDDAFCRCCGIEDMKKAVVLDPPYRCQARSLIYLCLPCANSVGRLARDELMAAHANG